MRYVFLVFAVVGWAWLAVVFGFLMFCLRGRGIEKPGFEVIQHDEEQH